MLWRSKSTVGLVIACVGFAACSGATDDSNGTVGPAVRPFREVQASEIAFESDPSDLSRGIFRVTTTEPMICAIVWGTDDTYGRFNNSLSMNGTGIAQHDVVLPDIEAGRRYRYIVQGTTADGTLYRSEPGTFSIDPTLTGSATDQSDEPNVALVATVIDVSSEFSAAFAATNAVDGETSSEWATAGDGDDGYIELDLGADVDIDTVEFLTRSMADGSAVTAMFTVTLDGATQFGPFPAGTVAVPLPATVAATGRRIRFDVETSTGGNVGAVEIRVHPEPR